VQLVSGHSLSFVERTFPPSAITLRSVAARGTSSSSASRSIWANRFRSRSLTRTFSQPSRSQLSRRPLLECFGWPAGRIRDLGGIASARGTEMFVPLGLRLWERSAPATSASPWCARRRDRGAAASAVFDAGAVSAVSTPAIETRGLTKFYGETRGIEDLDSPSSSAPEIGPAMPLDNSSTL
jgi:hypothetical protein